MKIGILTQHFLLNYGGIIQNYALQQVLVRLGHQPLTFEHDTCYSTAWWLLRVAKHLLKTHSLADMPKRPVYKGRLGSKNFVRFVTRHIQSVCVHDFTPALTRHYGINAYVVGSDQVWRPAFNLGPRLGNMFLDFAGDEVRKTAYAASFGTDCWEYTDEQTSRCQRLAHRFHAISVREQSGVTLCRDHLGVNATLVADPTLLLTKEDYLPLCESCPRQKAHIFVYTLVQKEQLRLLSSTLSRQTQLPITFKGAGDNVQDDDTIEAWLAEFRDAGVVLTDSFHGMVFSILFHKPFWIVCNPSGGNERYVSLLTLLGLMDRIVPDDGPLSTTPIDWQAVDHKLEPLRAKSINFLKENLK